MRLPTRLAAYAGYACTAAPLTIDPLALLVRLPLRLLVGIDRVPQGAAGLCGRVDAEPAGERLADPFELVHAAG
jgi:hypothetical protein